MTRSKPSFASPPEFFVDRCLGKGTPRTLIEAGWTLHMVSDVFPADGQFTGDDEWIEYGLKRGWTMLTQDKRIRNQLPVLNRLVASGLTIHCLSSAELTPAKRAERFERHRDRIWRYGAEGPPGFYVVYEDSVVRRWP
ncbi:hypothetical protein [Micromonospora carbonacea]|uniref:VapC45 PIN like domain-containing protein n=1 Tax=Micromonospora carbonacea TaxID=47853 RepID=A0A7H8XN49_9ACTN|nr:hypothetical protein [Micromonospora carbonacea]MBB5826932.1 hypothetical protein [Micromonospora carbonacea]QLD25232.1 hypothetical protein HXZ27_14270 [Micromonospora carbonacea]